MVGALHRIIKDAGADFLRYPSKTGNFKPSFLFDHINARARMAAGTEQQ